jgi:ABC-type multidrug transport system fused ATPase/permease subunit
MLSGGQRQRAALARAFYRDFDLLLLDDVLSAVDHNTEKRLIDSIYETIQKQGRSATTLIVSHRISALRHADKIIVLDDGKVVAEGRHDELLRDEDGPYWRAWRLQQARERDEVPPSSPPLNPAVAPKESGHV